MSAADLTALTRDTRAARAAVATLDAAAPALARAVRRSVPFFAQRGLTVLPKEASTVPSSELCEGVEGPVFVAELAVDPGGARAFLVVDGPAIAFLLDGALGGDGETLPELDEEKLTSTQRAFARRMAAGVVTALSDALSSSLGVRVQPLPESDWQSGPGAALVMLPLVIADGDPDEEDPEAFGTLRVALSRHGLAAGRDRGQSSHGPIDRRLCATVGAVEVELTAELGRLTLPLSSIARLGVGDVLPLDVPVRGDVALKLDDRVVFRGKPTTEGSRVAVRVLERVGEGRPLEGA